MRGARLTPFVALLGAVAFAMGCAVQASDQPAGSTGEVTHALVAVERSTIARTPELARAQAFAGFLQIPAGTRPSAVLPLVGLGLDLPAAGACRVQNDEAAEPVAGVTAVELLDAGEVTLVADGAVTTLAPRAFPSVTDSISGVVYTTRDRAAEPLPAAARYALATTGSAALGPISVEAPAPAMLERVTVGGQPLGEHSALAAARVLEVTWQPGRAGDLVVVELTSSGSVAVCTFRDDAGRGSVPASALPTPGEAELSVHRLRETPFADPSLAGGVLRFDFELSEPVVFE